MYHNFQSTQVSCDMGTCDCLICYIGTKYIFIIDMYYTVRRMRTPLIQNLVMSAHGLTLLDLGWCDL